MARLPKKYIKAAGGINKKAWRLWNAAKSKVKRGKSKVVRAVMVRKKSSSKRVVTAPIKKRKSNKGARAMGKQVVIFKDRTVNTVAKTGIAVTVAVASSMALESFEATKKLKTGTKVLIQGGAGGALVYFGKKQPWFTLIGVGLLTGAGMSVALPLWDWVKRGFEGPIFSGPGGNGNLTSFQRRRMAAKTRNMAGPVDRMAGPVDRMAGPWQKGSGNPSNMGNRAVSYTTYTRSPQRRFVTVN